VYLPRDAEAASLMARLRDVEGVELALASQDACARFELPADRIGDIVVLSTRRKVLGTSEARHDLSGLDEPLRSHGGLNEQVVPMIVNRKVSWPKGRELRNFDVFALALNHVEA
jgi:phosphonoacetate hydrolase